MNLDIDFSMEGMIKLNKHLDNYVEKILFKHFDFFSPGDDNQDLINYLMVCDTCFGLIKNVSLNQMLYKQEYLMNSVINDLNKCIDELEGGDELNEYEKNLSLHS